MVAYWTFYTRSLTHVFDVGSYMNQFHSSRMKQQVTLSYLNTSHHPEGAAMSSSKPGFDPTEFWRLCLMLMSPSKGKTAVNGCNNLDPRALLRRFRKHWGRDWWLPLSGWYGCSMLELLPKSFWQIFELCCFFNFSFLSSMVYWQDWMLTILSKPVSRWLGATELSPKMPVLPT